MLKARRRTQNEGATTDSNAACMYLRGILPVSAMRVPAPPPLTARLHLVVAPPAKPLPSGTYCTDATDGKYTKTPEARRCGAGLVYLEPGNPLVRPWGAFGGLPGEVQTVHRVSSLPLCSVWRERRMEPGYTQSLIAGRYTKV